METRLGDPVLIWKDPLARVRWPSALVKTTYAGRSGTPLPIAMLSGDLTRLLVQIYFFL